LGASVRRGQRIISIITSSATTTAYCYNQCIDGIEEVKEEDSKSICIFMGYVKTFEQYQKYGMGKKFEQPAWERNKRKKTIDYRLIVPVPITVAVVVAAGFQRKAMIAGTINSKLKSMPVTK
jgi:hypothetical protein